jgi:hypothetical protein
MARLLSATSLQGPAIVPESPLRNDINRPFSIKAHLHENNLESPQRTRSNSEEQRRKLSQGVFGRRSVGPAEGRGSHRLASLDAARGLTVCMMMFVDETGHKLMGYVNHSPWDNLGLADFVMPFFLFLVGFSMAISFRKYSASNSLLWKVVGRTVKLIIIGLATQGGDLWTGDGFDLANIRISGILQRIAFAYFVVAMMVLYLPRLTQKGFRRPANADFTERGSAVRGHFFLRIFRFYALHWLVAFGFLGIYTGLTFGMPVATWSHTVPRVLGQPACNESAGKQICVTPVLSDGASS